MSRQSPPSRPLRHDDHAADTLDVAPLLEWFAGHAASSLGRDRVLDRRPRCAAPESFEPEQQLIREAWDVLNRREVLPVAGLFDASPQLAPLAMPGGRLDPEGYQRLAMFVVLAGPAASFARTHAETHPALAALLAPMTPLPEIERAIRSTIDENGLVRDDASPALRRIRFDLRRAESRIHSEIARLAREFSASGALSDSFHTMRNGRHCLPVAAGKRGAVSGIVHGHSGSGETIFIEPAAIVELANDIADLTAREADEVERILIELASTIRPHLPALHANLDTFAALDDLHARADAGWRAGWALARLGSGDDAVRLDRVHHPLLKLRRPEVSVPLSFSLERKARVLVLSGPNAGGKTTTLKTLGLASWLAQAGFPIPCGPDTHLPIVPHLGVAIGDEQSVAEGESTFSAHIRRLRTIVEESEQGSLVLLDEIAAGTDPTEGGALAIALLEALAQRGARVACTTHIARLTEWADGEEMVRNASFRLDPKTSAPTFELLIGVAGTSHALLAAERGGLPSHIIQRAKELIPRERIEAGELLLTLEAKHREADDTMRAAQMERERIDRDAADLDRRIATHREEKRTYREGVLAAHRRELARLREQVDRALSEAATRDAATTARELVDQASGDVGRQIAEVRAERAEPGGASTGELRVGEVVKVGPLRTSGRVLGIDVEKGLVRLDVSGMTLEMPASQLGAAPLAPEQEALLEGLDDLSVDDDNDQATSGKKSQEGGNARATAAITRRRGRGLFRNSPASAVRASAEAKPADDDKPKRRRSAKNRKFDETEYLASNVSNKPKAPPPTTVVATAMSDALSSARAAAAKQSRPDRSSRGRPVIDGDDTARAPSRAPLPLTLDLHGKRVEEALPMVDDYLDRAILNDWPHVRLMHGVGTGRLGRAIRDHLKLNPHIDRAYPADPEGGGSGVTIVEFRE